MTQLLPNLHLLTPGGWQVYLWRDEDGITLVDSGAAGSAAPLREDLAELGIQLGDVDRIVLTHFHDDHAGGAAEIVDSGAVEVLAHEQDTPIIRGEQAGPPPTYSSEAERALHEHVARDLPPAPSCRVDRELVDGQVLDIGGQGLVVATPGHTEGSMALFLPQHGVLFTGDTIAEHEGDIILGPFNLDRDRAAASFRALADLDVNVACFGHGTPVVEGAGRMLRAAAANMTAI